MSCDKSDDTDIIASFEELGVDADIAYVDVGQERVLRYICVNRAGADAPWMVFVHGAPGGMDQYYDYMQDSALVTTVNMISVDRLGYGGSGEGDPEPSLEVQAEAVLVLVQEAIPDSQRVMMLGHSYGGPIIAKAAALRPDLVHGLIFLAPAIDPEHEKFVWAGRLGNSAPGRWVTSKSMEVASAEKVNHEEELRLMLNDWDSIQAQTIYVHGTKDGIVPYENFDFAKERLAHVNPNMVTIHGGNHFIPFNEQELVREKILELCDLMDE